MSPDVLTPVQRSWANRVLGLLGKTPTRDGASDGLAEIPEASGEPAADVVDRYGTGYKPFKLEARGKLKEALDKKPPAKAMISFDDWKGLATSQEAQNERKAALDKAGEHAVWLGKRAEIEGKIADLNSENNEWVNSYQKLKLCKGPPPADCDLTGVPPFNKKVPANKVVECMNAAIIENKKRLAELSEVKKTQLTPLQESMAACLPLLDAPENNPERAEVGKLLEGMEALEQQIGKNDGALTKDLAAEKVKALAALEKKVFEWNDRRAAQNLPPSAEAVALLDLHQTVHRQMIAEVLKNPAWDPPVAGYEKLPTKEQAQLKKTWDDLRDNSLEKPDPAKGKILIPTSPFKNFKRDEKDEIVNDSASTENEAKLFRVETMANFSRLLASEAGRFLVNELNAGGNTVKVVMTRGETCCGAEVGDKAGMINADGSAGTAAKSMVYMPSGASARDSEMAQSTESGNYLYAPQFINMGHELVHALHTGRGKNKHFQASPKDADWSNQEEYRTIFKGKTSEQTLRHQYGLTTLRHGHHAMDPKDEVAKAFVDAVQATKDLSNEKNRARIENSLTTKGFDPAKLTDVKKLEYEASKVDGAKLLELGWDPNLLTVDQAEHVIDKNVKSAVLEKLGWSPLELRGKSKHNSIGGVILTKSYHPRSPQGHRFAVLGGKSALLAVADLNARGGCHLKEGAKNDGVDQLKALKEADAWLRTYAKKDAKFKTRVLAKNKLHEQLIEAATYFEEQKGRQEQEVAEVKDKAEKAGAALPTETIAEFKNVEVGKGSEYNHVVRLLEEMTQARVALLNGQGSFADFKAKVEAVAGRAKTVGEAEGGKDKTCEKACRLIVRKANSLLDAAQAVHDTTTAAVLKVEALGPEAAKKRESMLTALDAMLNAQYVEATLRDRGRKAVQEARADIDAPPPKKGKKAGRKARGAKEPKDNN